MTKASLGEAAQTHHEEATPGSSELVESIAEASEGTLSRGTLVGQCLEARHPVLAGRVSVAWLDPRGHRTERWLAALQGVVIREGDRVLLDHPANWPEPIVVGVVDGFESRPAAPKREAGSIALEMDETIRVTTPAGDPLLELTRSKAGPVVRLLLPDVALEVDGALRVNAKAIELRAREGEIRLAATADVNIEGETINLN